MKVYKIKQGPYVVEEPVENHENNFKKGIVTPMKPQGLGAFTNSKEIKRYEFPTFYKLIDFFSRYEQD
jgi:hypothetical protein